MSMKDKNRFFNKGKKKRSFDPRIDRDEYTPPPGFKGMAQEIRPPKPKDTEKKGKRLSKKDYAKKIMQEMEAELKKNPRR